MLILILGMAAVTLFSRFFPMVLLTRWTLPEKMRLGLDYIPVAILSAIVFPILFLDGKGNPGFQLQCLFSAVPVFAFAWRLKSIWGSVVLGMVIYWILGMV
jgi:branched-subunit amino acid transport protein